MNGKREPFDLDLFTVLLFCSLPVACFSCQNSSIHVLIENLIDKKDIEIEQS